MEQKTTATKIFSSNLERDERIQLAKAKAAAMDLIFVDAIIESKVSLENVPVQLPAIEDIYLVLCREHKYLVPCDPDLTDSLNVMAVNQHYRRSLPFPNGKKVFRNFYTTDASLLGKKVLADVEIKIKNDYSRNGEKSVILDYVNIRANTLLPAENIITVGTTHGQIPIFGTDKFVRYEKNEKRVAEKGPRDKIQSAN